MALSSLRDMFCTARWYSDINFGTYSKTKVFQTPFAVILRRIAWCKFTNVSEKPTVSIIEVKDRLHGVTTHKTAPIKQNGTI